MEVVFQTLKSVQVKFAVKSILILRDADSQPFIEVVRSKNGTTDLEEIGIEFGKWVYQEKIADTSHIVVLVTGSAGSFDYRWKLVTCNNDQVTTAHENRLILRFAQSTLRTTVFSRGLAKMFGSTFDKDTSCNTTSWLLAATHDPIEEHYMSQCSEDSMKTYIDSLQRSCFKRSQNSDMSKTIDNIQRVSFSIAEQCQIRYSNYTNVTTDRKTESCSSTGCYRNSSDGLKYINLVYPIDGTPCGQNKICFRGRCISDGVIIKNLKSQRCILPSYNKDQRKRLILQSCPAYPLNFDKFSIFYNAMLGAFLSAPSNNINFNETALTVLNSRVEFVNLNASSFNVNNVLWDILEVGDGSFDILICHRQTKKCISRSLFNELILDDGADSKDFSQRWRFEDGHLFSLTYKRQPVETEYVIRRLLKLAIVCDINCGKVFMFNKTTSNNYWKILLEDAASKFETMTTIQISFVITSLVNLWEPRHSNLNSKKIFPSQSDSLETINESFGVWLNNQIEKLPPFDVAVLGTAFLETQLKTFSNQASACKSNGKTRRQPGTSVFRVDMQKANDFSELADSLGKILEEEENNKRDGPLDRKRPCTRNNFLFSKCQEKNMQKYLMSEEANCLNQNNDEPKSLFLLNGQGKVPSFQEQCNFMRNNSDLIVKETNENCLVTRCLNHEGKNLFVKNINPLHRTPCGNEMHCLWGHCLPISFPLQKVDTTMCLSGTRLFSPNDLVTLSDCRFVSSSLNHFAITELYDKTGYMLVSPLSPADKTDSDRKCLTWEPERQYLHYNPCPSSNFKKFVWNILEVPNSNGQFLLHHKLSKKCIGVTHNTVFPVNTNCEFLDLHSKETVVRQGCRMPTKPYIDIQFISDSACSLKDMTLRWQKLSISSEYNMENIGSYIIPPPSKSADGKHEALTENSDLWIYVLVGVTILIVLLASIVGIAIVIRRSKVRSASQRNEMVLGESFYQGNVGRINPDISVTAQVDLLPFDRRLEFPFDQLCLGKFLGAGTQGKVFEGKAFGITTNQEFTHVAVKMVEATAGSSEDHFHDLLSELKILCYVGRHPNVIGLLGACTNDISLTKKLCMITEYCKHGNLRNFLLVTRKSFVNFTNDTGANDLGTMSGPSQGNPVVHNQNLDKTISTHDLIGWSFQLAQGMEYLASKKVLHGDLAARNVLLAENSIIKICDFGFSRKLAQGYNYNYQKCMKDTKMPVKWMATESLKHGLFSIQSDCWAFGVVLWEMFSFGDIPYAGTKVDEQFVSRLCNGHRLEKPEFAPSRIYDIMNQCWLQEPDTRPSFSELVEKLGDMLTAGQREHYAQLDVKIQNNMIYEEIENPATNSQHTNDRMKAEDPNRYMALTSRPNNCDVQSDNPGRACGLLENRQGFKFVKEINKL